MSLQHCEFSKRETNLLFGDPEGPGHQLSSGITRFYDSKCVSQRMRQHYHMTNHRNAAVRVRTSISPCSRVRGLPDLGGLCGARLQAVFFLDQQLPRACTSHGSDGGSGARAWLPGLCLCHVFPSPSNQTRRTIEPKVKGWEVPPISSRGSCTAAWTERVVQIGANNIIHRRWDYKFPCLPGPGLPSYTSQDAG